MFFLSWIIPSIFCASFPAPTFPVSCFLFLCQFPLFPPFLQTSLSNNVFLSLFSISFISTFPNPSCCYLSLLLLSSSKNLSTPFQKYHLSLSHVESLENLSFPFPQIFPTPLHFFSSLLRLLTRLPFSIPCNMSLFFFPMPSLCPSKSFNFQ